MTFKELKKLLDKRAKGSSPRKQRLYEDFDHSYDPKNPPKPTMTQEEMYESLKEMRSEKGYSKGGLVKGFKGTF